MAATGPGAFQLAGRAQSPPPAPPSRLIVLSDWVGRPFAMNSASQSPFRLRRSFETRLRRASAAGSYFSTRHRSRRPTARLFAKPPRDVTARRPVQYFVPPAGGDLLILSAQLGRARFARRETVREIFARIVATADGDDDVLPAVHHVSHRGAALRCRHPDRADFLPHRFIVGAQHGA